MELENGEQFEESPIPFIGMSLLKVLALSLPMALSAARSLPIAFGVGTLGSEGSVSGGFAFVGVVLESLAIDVIGIGLVLPQTD